MQRRALLLASAAALLPVDRLSARAPGETMLTLRVAGARAPIEILEDGYGIPHIRAQSKHDAFFGQGYVVARDRLFQLDLSHRRDLGRMAEAFGPRFLPFDRAARLFLYHGDMDAELAALPPEALDCARGYVAGINARIAELNHDPRQLPLEYGLLGITPLPWDVRDLIRIRSFDLGDVDDEVRHARLQARGLLEWDRLFEPLQPAVPWRIPEGLDCAAVSEADLGALAELAKPLPWADTQAAFRDALPDHRTRRQLDGSNAWTVAGTRTASGRPILANDPHLAIGGACPRHIAHLTAPGLDVIGGGEPGLPGIMQGHTDRFAFGRTNFHIDQTDLFILRTKADDPEAYWHKGAWQRFETIEEEIAVKGAANEKAVLRYAQGRPVLSRDPARQRATALATVTLLPGANMQFAMIAINLAQDWAGLQQAFKLHSAPTNFHYADIAGNTGWHAIGFAPKRPRHDGLLPAPGDGDYDWTGILPVTEMPHLYNPAQGWFASANQWNLPPGYPYPLSYNWTDPFRYNRIVAVLRTQPRHRLEDSIALQQDIQSLPAQALLALLPTTPSPAAAPAVALLRGWDCTIGVDSAAAALYEMVLPALNSAFRNRVIPAAAQDLLKSVNLSAMLRLLTDADPRLGSDPAAVRAALLDQALTEGWSKAVALLGPDPAQWRWGDIHRVSIGHRLAAVRPDIAAAFPRIEGGRSGGDSTTVMARGVNASRGDYNVMHGASYLFVADVGAWDNSRFLLLPGQSADPRSPHYRDGYADWLAGAMQPLWFSKAAVDTHAVGRSLLLPE